MKYPIIFKGADELGLKNIYSFTEFLTEENKFQAKEISKKFNSKSSLINYAFPENVPGIFLYDAMASSVRRPTITSPYLFAILRMFI